MCVCMLNPTNVDVRTGEIWKLMDPSAHDRVFSRERNIT